jgi:hypothetical protein
MRPTLQYLEEKFDYYNNLCFGGQLPRPPISLNLRRGSVGLTYEKFYLENGVIKVGYNIQISVRLDLPEEEYIDTLVHEMIHYYIGINNLKDESPHGKIFMAKMHEITSTYGIKVTVVYDEDDETAIARISNKIRYICVADFNNGRTGFAIVVRNKVFEFWQLFSKIPNAEVHWYASNRGIFEKYKVVISPKLVPIDANKLHHYLTGAIELENTGSEIKSKSEYAK